jgi:carbonic anhydrase
MVNLLNGDSMKKVISSIIVATAIITTIASCHSGTAIKQTANPDSLSKTSTAIPAPLKVTVLTAAEQQALTPDMVIQRLKDGNKRFLDNNLTTRDHSALVRDAAGGQYPQAVVLSCMDSRVPVEDIFDNAIGDLFVCRVAGNVLNEDILASLEYGTRVSGAKLIVVMGHKNCGAIKSAIKGVQLGNITSLLEKVKPAIAASNNFAGEKNYNNDAYVTAVAINNVKNVVEEIKKKSPVLKEMAAKGELKIVGAGYNLNNGEVVFF